MDYRTAIDWLESHINFEGHNNAGDRDEAPDAGSGSTPSPSMPTAGQTDALSLGPMQELLSLLGDPHEAYRVIHLTGTNGKGSTSRYISALLTATELSVGTYTSPNLEKINERIVWDGHDIPDEDFARILTLIREVMALMDGSPSRFEILTAVAFVWFAEVGAEVAVIEVGLLGRYDATNVVTADVAVITNIGKDHTDGVGEWRQAIASEKAGIIKPESRVILGEPFEDLRPIVDAEPSEFVWELENEVQLEQNTLGVGGRIVSVVTPLGEYTDVFVPAFGEHQGRNAATALAAVDAFFGRSLDQELVEAAFAGVELPGRFELARNEPTVILDGGHNPDGIATVKATLDEAMARLGSWVLVIGLLNGKDPIEMLEAVDAADFDAVIVCEPSWSRAIPATELAAAAASIGVDAEVVPDPREAFARARAVTSDDDLILVTGSMYIIGEIRPLARSVVTDIDEGELLPDFTEFDD